MANVLATVLLPVTLVFLLVLANDRELMGAWANRLSTNVIGITVIAFVGVCGSAYGIVSFLAAAHLLPRGSDTMPGPDRQQPSPATYYLEPEQFLSRTREPVPRATLSPAAKAGLLALRVFSLAVSFMVLYTFLRQL